MVSGGVAEGCDPDLEPIGDLVELQCLLVCSGQGGDPAGVGAIDVEISVGVDDEDVWAIEVRHRGANDRILQKVEDDPVGTVCRFTETHTCGTHLPGSR